MKRKKIKGIIFPKVKDEQVEKNKKNTTMRRKFCQATPQKICLQLSCHYCGYSLNNSKIYNKYFIKKAEVILCELQD